MQKFTLAIRIIFGLIFVVFGLNGFFNFIPMPQDMPQDMITFSSGLMVSKYFFPLLKGSEVICGLFLLSGYFVPLALVILAPIVINIFFVHAFLAPDGMAMSIALVLMQAYLSFFARPYSDKIKALFRP